MNVVYGDKVRQFETLLALAEKATERLKEIVGTSQGTATWDLDIDKTGFITLSLRLSDWAGSVEGTFTPEELQHPSQMRIRLLELWGDLLQARAHHQLRELQEAWHGLEQ